MKDFFFKRIGNLNVLIQKKLKNTFTDKWWHDICSANYNKCCLIKRGTYKSVFTKSFKGNIFFIKKYKNPGCCGIIKSVFFNSRAKKEFCAGIYIKSRGIPSPEPLFMAEVKEGLAVKESFIAMSFLHNAVELKDIYFKLSDIKLNEKNMLTKEVGRLTGRVFENAILQQDCSVNNFMVIKDGKGLKPVFIDFEKVKINRKISDGKRTELLAKLNRVGREISLKDRLRFLRGYIEVDRGIAPSIRILAQRVQENTVKLLKKDIKRKRATSIYTHGEYIRIKSGTTKAIFRKDLNPDELIEKTVDMKESKAEISGFNNHNSEIKLLNFKLQAEKALKLWSVINILIVAGLPVDMPLCLIQTDDKGFIIFSEIFFEQYKDFTIKKTGINIFLNRNFSKELLLLEAFVQRFKP